MKKIIISLICFEQVIFSVFGTAQVYAQTEATTSSSLETGDAQAVSNSIDITNLQTTDSTVTTILQNIEGTQSGDINFENLSEASAPGQLTLSDSEIIATQSAEVESDTQAVANTGENEVEATSSSIDTGNATSISNSITATNLNLVGSNVVFGIVNILGDLTGDVVLPNVFSLSTPLLSSLISVNTTLNAEINADTKAISNTGSNSQEGDNSLIDTGQATSSANLAIFTNLTQIGNTNGHLIVNNFGEWLGNLINWSGPGISETLPAGSSELTNSWNTSIVSDDEENLPALNLVSNQTAKVTTTTVSSSNTGGNSQKGDSSIMATGDALSIANSITLTNFTNVGGGSLFGIVNILGSWKGNLIVAYPRLSVSLSDSREYVNPGGEEEYVVTITNKGKAKAKNINLTFSFPNKVLAKNNLKTDQILPELGAGESKTYLFNGTVFSNLSAGYILDAKVSVTSPDVQESTEENVAEDFTTIVNQENYASDHRYPDLEVGVSTNVNNFVNQGDTVRAYATIVNRSDYSAKNVSLKGTLSGDGENDIPMEWYIGNLNAHAKAKIEFNIEVIGLTRNGMYVLKIYAKSFSAANDEIDSNTAETSFKVNAINGNEREMPITLTDAKKGIVLSDSTSRVNYDYTYKNNLLYFFPVLIFLNIFVFFLKKKLI